MSDDLEVTKKLHATTDAMVWAQEWCRIAREIVASNDERELIDEGWMVGWFANAMCVAEDHLKAERDLLIARQDALVRYLGRDEFLLAVGEVSSACEAAPPSPGALCSPTYDRQPFD